MLLFLKLVVLIFFIFMSLFTFVSLVTHNWIQDNLEHKQGLWYYCNDEAQDCEPIKDHQRIINMGGIPGSYQLHTSKEFNSDLPCMACHIYSPKCHVAQWWCYHFIDVMITSSLLGSVSFIKLSRNLHKGVGGVFLFFSSFFSDISKFFN